MSDNSNNQSGGIGFGGLLLLLFITLKLTGVITWSWWWVMSPLWGIFAIGLGAAIIYWVFILIASLFSSNKRDDGGFQ